jgi:hypothetical protein
MEAPVQAPVIETPTPTPQSTPPVAQATPSFEGGGDTNVIEKMANDKPYSILTIVTFGLIFASAWYSIMYHRKAIQKLEEAASKDEFENLVDDVEEVKYNVKKALGKKYTVSQ